MPAKKEEPKKKVDTQAMAALESSEPLRVRVHQRSGLLFPVGRIFKLMKKGRYADRISLYSAIGVGAVLEYLATEIIEMAGDGCFDGDRKLLSSVIKPRHIGLAIKGDPEMSKALGTDVIIPMSGVIPFIHEELQRKDRGKKRKNKENRDSTEEKFSQEMIDVDSSDTN